MFINFIKENLSDLDAIVESGDWEVAICNYAKYLQKIDFTNIDIPGITIKENGQWKEAKRCNGENFTDWEFLDLNTDLINKDLYLSLKDNEVTISVSRGCPYNCKFCLAVKTFDKVDRRKEPKLIVEYMKKNRNKVKRFKLFSPTFTYDSKWVEDLCNLILEEHLEVNWVVTSRPDCLQNEGLIKLMAKAGCKKIAVGIETLDEISNKELKKFNNIENYKSVVRNMFYYARNNGIEVKPLLMMGIKGQDIKNIKETLLFLNEIGAKDIRVAAYSPRQDLTDNERLLTMYDIAKMDKMTYINYLPIGLNENKFLNMIYGTKNYLEILNEE